MEERRYAPTRLIASAVASAALIVASASGAAAADLAGQPYGKAPAVAAIFDWGGFYAGLHAGYSWSKNPWTSRGLAEDPTGLFTVGNFTPRADHVLGGVQAGSNYQMANWVVGIEADLSVIGSKGSAGGTVSQQGVLVPGFVTTGTAQVEWLALFTGRVGYAWDRTLLYVKGGVAGGGTKENFSLATRLNNTPAFFDFGTKTNVQVGSTIGAGIEHAFAPHWSAKIEYNFVDLGKSSENFNLTNNLTFKEDIDHRIHIVKVGANYRF